MKLLSIRWTIAVVAVAILAAHPDAVAQQTADPEDSALPVIEPRESPDTKLNIAFGLGIGIAPGMTQGASAAILTLKASRLVYSLRYAHSTEVNILGGATVSETDFALLVGVSSADDEGSSVALQVGMACTMADVVEKVTNDFYYRSTRVRQETALGLAYQAQLYYRHVGIVVFGNANSAASFGGALLCLRLGNVF